LFTKGGGDTSTLEPLGYAEVHRRSTAPDARLDQPVVEILAGYLRERASEWITEEILALADPVQEEALRSRVVFAAAEFYADEFDAATRELDEARAQEREALGRLEVLKLVDLGFDMGRQGRHGEALALYRQAAARGNAVAMCNIAASYGRGHGVPKDDSLDFEWSLACARAGNAHGMWRVSLAYSTDSDLSRNFFPSIPKNADESFAWALKAAQLGHKLAMRNLAEMYAEGRGTRQDSAEANRWMQLANSEGDDPSGAQGDPGK
jgi:TPR repeat protein